MRLARRRIVCRCDFCPPTYRNSAVRDAVYANNMSFWAKAIRFTALFLVLFTAGDLVACELPSSDCSASQALDKRVPAKSCDNCICCCANVVVTPQVIFVAPITISVVPVEKTFLLPTFPTLEIDRPPQLS